MGTVEMDAIRDGLRPGRVHPARPGCSARWVLQLQLVNAGRVHLVFSLQFSVWHDLAGLELCLFKVRLWTVLSPEPDEEDGDDVDDVAGMEVRDRNC